MSSNRERLNSNSNRKISNSSEDSSDCYNDDEDSCEIHSSNENLVLESSNQVNLKRSRTATPVCYDAQAIRINPRPSIHVKDREIQETKSFRSFVAKRITLLQLTIFVGIVSILLYYGYWSNPTEKTCNFDILAKKYQQQDKASWEKLRVGIENVINNKRNTPAVFLFLHQNSTKTQKMIDEIVQNSLVCLGPNKNLVELSHELFKSDQTASDYGFVIDYFYKNIKNENIVWIANLNEIPSYAALSLHSICDTYKENAYNAIIFMTLLTSTSSDKPRNIAFYTLQKQWHELADNDLEPLIARVTDEVIQLNDF